MFNSSTILFEIPADVNYTPLSPTVPGHLLDPTDYRPDEPERDRWLRVTRLLPEGRQARIAGCGRNAVHISRTTHAGRLENLQPVSCMDKAVCPYCGNRYASDLAVDRLAKLMCVCKGARAPLVVVEARATCSTWNAAVRASGCATAENRGRLCGSGQGCAPCRIARDAHIEAARIEGELQRKLTRAWLKNAPHTGGVYMTRVEPNGLSLDIVVTLLVPAVVVTMTNGVGKLGFFTPPDVDKLRAAFPDGRVSVEYFDGDGDIQREIFMAHLPAIERLLLARTPVTQDSARTLARALGLAVETKRGKFRRVQRTAWFGIFSGRSQGAVLSALQVSRVDHEKDAQIVVEDHFKILKRDAERVSVQSTRTGLKREFPATMWKPAYVDMNGAPLSGLDKTTWVHTRGYAEKLFTYQQLLDGARTASNIAFSEPKTKNEYQRAQYKVWGSLIGPRFSVIGRPGERSF